MRYPGNKYHYYAACYTYTSPPNIGKQKSIATIECPFLLGESDWKWEMLFMWERKKMAIFGSVSAVYTGPIKGLDTRTWCLTYNQSMLMISSMFATILNLKNLFSSTNEPMEATFQRWNLFYSLIIPTLLAYLVGLISLFLPRSRFLQWKITCPEETCSTNKSHWITFHKYANLLTRRVENKINNKLPVKSSLWLSMDGLIVIVIILLYSHVYHRILEFVM